MSTPWYSETQFNAFLDGYLEELVSLGRAVYEHRAGDDDEDMRADDFIDVDDLDTDIEQEAHADCAAFMGDYGMLLKATGQSMSELGRLFLLSRNGHGAGFFDLCNNAGNTLQEHARVYGTFELEVWVDAEGELLGMATHG